jgi:hypothetical protein
VEVVRGGAVSVFKRIFSRENILALLICLIVILLIIATTDQSPLWIYQGF